MYEINITNFLATTREGYYDNLNLTKAALIDKYIKNPFVCTKDYYFLTTNNVTVMGKNGAYIFNGTMLDALKWASDITKEYFCLIYRLNLKN